MRSRESGKMCRVLTAVLTVGATMALATPAAAQPAEEQPAAERLEIKPVLDTRARYEHVEQGSLDADAVTLRVRAGAEARYRSLSLLGEGEATVAPVNPYNAFPFPIAGERQRRPGQAVVPDPENAEVNRLQLQYRHGHNAVTAGRQRIDLDNQRWVGSVGWRQNEQTFDALRGEAKLGPAAFDVTYAVSQRTVFGIDAGPRTALDGDFVFAGASAKSGAVSGKLFAYLLDYDEPAFIAASSQTFGGFLVANLPLARFDVAEVRAAYARQFDYGSNPADYAADYWSLEASGKLARFEVRGGIETLGSDRGRAVQTPMATLHKFNGWADAFLTTPPEGLQDLHLSVARMFDGIKALPGLRAGVSLHRFRSADGHIAYGKELDASLGMRIGLMVVLLKYARYEAESFGTDTGKFWLQFEAAL